MEERFIQKRVRIGPYDTYIRYFKGKSRIFCPHCNRWVTSLAGMAYACRKCATKISRVERKRNIKG